MVDPVIAAAVLLSAYRLSSSAERSDRRLADDRDLQDLVRCAAGLPDGTEVGTIRADGSSLWIRIPAAPLT